MEQKISIMQHNLVWIRETLGWSREDLGRRLGVTRQTICNIESRGWKLTQIQYMAIRWLLLQEYSKGNINEDQMCFIEEKLLKYKMKKITTFQKAE